MAPKKRGRKKEEAPKEQEVDDSIVPEHSREFYLIQIRDLEGRLARYQQKWDQLQVSEELFRCEYEKMLTDNKEIVAFLKKTLNQRVDEIADLTLQLQNLQQAKDLEKDAFETQLVQLRHEFQETKDQLTSENMLLSGKLAALEEFRLQKDEILAKFAERENQLRKEEEQHKDVIYNLERKAVIDKERMKKDMLHRVNAVAAEFRKVANNQMAETTKRTIRENVAISLQLTKVTEQSLQLIQENDRLKAAHAEAAKQLQLLEQNEKKMVKNSLGHQKMIWMLTEKCKELQSELEEQRKTKAHLAKVQKSSEMLLQQNLVLREELSMLKEDLDQKLAKDHDQLKLLQSEQQRRVHAENLLKHTAQGLKEALVERPLPEEEDRDFDVMFQLRRRNALQGILHFVQRGVARLDAQQGLQPITIESKVVKVTNLSRSFSTEWHTKASRTTSHCNIFQLPKPVHSLPSLESVSSTQLVSIRPYSSANESISSWRAENNSQGSPPARSAVHVPAEGGQGSEEVAIREDLPEIVSHLARQELLSK
ncbi:cilia- and flagella-associated protein 157 isoform X1 [Crotalus tigris]|uniref:cilia- and flagella-associated protein 157 isoform X1 n=2 Tax=Crotalus tigris TaxID=88082 RepID=UPI00192F26EB|nr:cilia- and flagella-associated protein 157 isoform X1 [Crotalus tigris]